MSRALTLAPAPVLAALLAVGCGHSETHVAALRKPGPPVQHPVEFYLAEKLPPQRPMLDIALVQAVGFGSESNAEDVVASLTRRAAGLGCDAVVRVYVDVGYSRAHAAGVCVRYIGDATDTTPASAPLLPPNKPANPPPPPMRPAPAPRLEPFPSSPAKQGNQ